MDGSATIELEKTCRTCMVQDTDNGHIPLFQSATSCQHKHPEALEELLFFNLGLWENDGLPQQICISCIDTFTQISEFRKQCNVVQDNLSVYRRLILEADEKIVEDYKPEYLTTDSVYKDNDPSVEKDANEDNIDQKFFKECIEEDYTMDFEENKDFGLCIEEKKIAVGNEDIKESHGNDVTEEVIESDFNCTYCKKKFLSRGVLLRHSKKCPGRNIEICDYCTKKFESKEKLEAHSKEKHSDGKFMCPICELTYTSAADRNFHITKSHESIDKFECFSCNNVFDTAFKLKRHVQRVHTVIENQCSICGKEFTSIFRYQYHMKTHNPKKKYQCQYCDKSFMQIHHKDNHERVHTGERPYLCNICGRCFKRERELHFHVLRHAQGKEIKEREPYERLGHKYYKDMEAPFRCSVCSKGFMVAYALAIHIKTHSKDRKYNCKECESSFKREAHLTSHTKRIHLKLRSFECDHCNKRFFEKGELNAHMVTHNDEKPFKCTFCSNTFKWKNSLVTHERTHTRQKQFLCEICNKRFMGRNTLVVHLMSHSDAQKKMVEESILRKLDDSDNEKTEEHFNVTVF